MTRVTKSLLYAAVALALLIALEGGTRAAEQVRLVVYFDGQDISSRCTAMVSTPDGMMAGMFIGEPEGLVGELPAGQYTAMIFDAGSSESSGVPAEARFKVVPGQETVVEVELKAYQALDQSSFSEIEAAAAMYGAMMEYDMDQESLESGSHYTDWDYGEPDYDDIYDRESREAGAVEIGFGEIDPWMVDLYNPPDVRPYGPLDEQGAK